jgi:hypothetical protein
MSALMARATYALRAANLKLHELGGIFAEEAIDEHIWRFHTTGDVDWPC